MPEEKQIEKRTYKIEYPILYNKKRYERGTIDMEPELGDPLVEQGVLAIPSPKDLQLEDGDDGLNREEKIRLAILDLNKENQDLWTGDGKPKTEALGLVEGSAVRAVERDTAWEKIKEAGE